MKVRQAGTGENDSVALFNAGTEGDSMEIDYKGDINMYKNVNISGDISANDASFNNIDIDENLKVINNLEVIGDISANDASFNNVDINGSITSNYIPNINYTTGFKGSQHLYGVRNDEITNNWNNPYNRPFSVDNNDIRNGGYSPLFKWSCSGGSIYGVNYSQGGGGITKQGLHLVPAVMNLPPIYNTVSSGILFQTFCASNSNKTRLCLGIGGTCEDNNIMRVHGKFTASSVHETSDNRLKFNQKEIKGIEALESIMKMKPKKYTKIISNYHNSKLNTLPTYNEWNDISNDYDTLIEIGLIAQDIKKIPLYKDIVTTEECDICGNINLISLNYNNILTTNISA